MLSAHKSSPRNPGPGRGDVLHTFGFPFLVHLKETAVYGC